MKNSFISVNGIKLIVFLLLSIFVCCTSYIEEKKKIGNSIIEKIEQFKKNNVYPPDRIYSVGSEFDCLIFQNDTSNVIRTSVFEIKGEEFCYERLDSVNYMIWFGTTLGEGMYYYSDTKKWGNFVK